MLTLDTHDGPMDLIVAEPAQTVRGGVVVLQEAFGLTSHIASICDRLAADGWLAVAPALYHRTGSPVFGYDQLPDVAPHYLAITAEGLEIDILAALGVLDGRGIAPPNRGIIGFCMGGTIALWAATVFDIGAGVTFYGSGVATGQLGLPPLVELAPRLRAPWQGHYGDLDKGIPVEQVEQLRTAAATAAVDSEVYRYVDGRHGFNCDDRAAYDEASASAAWARTRAWFDEHLTAP